MLNMIWLGMIFLAVIVGTIQGRLDLVVQSVTTSAQLGFQLALGLAGIMTLWLGIMNIASESGLIHRLAHGLRPLMKRLFPDVPPDDPAMGAMVLNIAANMLGMGNAATPFGLQAMKELQRLNTHVHTASNAMCTFLAINTASIQLIPATAMAYLAANGNLQPGNIIVSAISASMIALSVALIAVKQLAKLPIYQIKEEENL